MINKLWVVEFEIGGDWFPCLDGISGIRGIWHTRAEARNAKREIETARWYKTSVQYRVRKYQSISSSDVRSMEQWQKKYFPDSVGKECPYCGEKLRLRK